MELDTEPGAAIDPRSCNVEARADNASAIAFYRRQGFTPSGRVPDYYAHAVENQTRVEHVMA